MAARGGRRQPRVGAPITWNGPCAFNGCRLRSADDRLRACTVHWDMALHVIATMPSSATKYGLLPGDYWLLWARSNGLCAICRNEQRSQRLVVDHNHVTGEVRGLLCRGCNMGIGNLGDHSEWLARGANYLRTNGQYGEGVSEPRFVLAPDPPPRSEISRDERRAPLRAAWAAEHGEAPAS